MELSSISVEDPAPPVAKLNLEAAKKTSSTRIMSPRSSSARNIAAAVLNSPRAAAKGAKTGLWEAWVAAGDLAVEVCRCLHDMRALAHERRC